MNNNNEPWKILSSNILIWLVIVVIAAISFQMVSNISNSITLSQSDFKAYLNRDAIDNIEIDMIEITGTDFKKVDNRLLSLTLVKERMTDAVIFNPDGVNQAPGK